MSGRFRNPKCKLLPFIRTDIISLQSIEKQQLGWNITAFDLPKIWKESEGQGVKIAIIDTGCDLDHPDLVHSLIEGKNLISKGEMPWDDNGHGCVSGDSIVYTDKYSATSIEFLYEIINVIPLWDSQSSSWIKDISNLNIFTYSFDPVESLILKSKIKQLHKTLIKSDIVVVELEDDISLELTNWHKVYLIDEKFKIIKKRADELILGDKFIRPNGVQNCDLKTAIKYIPITSSTAKVKNIKKVKCNRYFFDFTINQYKNYIANKVVVSNTHSAGIIAAANNEVGIVGVAPKANIIPIKSLDKDGNGDLKTVSEGIYAAIEMGADIISMSLGSPVPLPQVHRAIKEAASKGIPVFVAAGNAGRTKDIFYPAAYQETIGIGAIDENFNRAKFSNTGRNLDFMAPGVNILSTVPDNWYALMSGTSQATPWVVGIAALFLSYCKKNNNNECNELRTVEDYKNKFKKHVIPLKDGNAGKEFFQGFGIIDVKGFLKDNRIE